MSVSHQSPGAVGVSRPRRPIRPDVSEFDKKTKDCSPDLLTLPAEGQGRIEEEPDVPVIPDQDPAEGDVDGEVEAEDARRW